MAAPAFQGCGEGCACYEPIRVDPAPGTMERYDQHVVAVSRETYKDWAEKIEKAGGPLGALSKALKSGVRIKFTAAEAIEGSSPGPSGAGLDLLVFPAKAKYKDVSEAQMPAVVAAIKEGARDVEGVVKESLEGQVHVLVCAHDKRDSRCGSSGPVLARQFIAEAAKRSLDNVQVWHTSHVGGHVFAGNILVYPGIGSAGEIYGYVSAEKNDVGRIIQNHLVTPDIKPLVDLWRGRFGMSGEDHIELARSIDPTCVPPPTPEEGGAPAEAAPKAEGGSA